VQLLGRSLWYLFPPPADQWRGLEWQVSRRGHAWAPTMPPWDAGLAKLGKINPNNPNLTYFGNPNPAPIKRINAENAKDFAEDAKEKECLRSAR
jgi:hypothetical protein